MKFCWHDWHVWKEVFSYKREIFALGLRSVLFIGVAIASMFILNRMPLTQGVCASFIISGSITSLLVGLVYGIIGVASFMDRQGPGRYLPIKDKTCVKCGKTSLRATDLVNADARKREEDARSDETRKTLAKMFLDDYKESHKYV